MPCNFQAYDTLMQAYDTLKVSSSAALKKLAQTISAHVDQQRVQSSA